ncbi:hypothetical protein MPC1_7060006 [Methylocella tundrae]|nr:hypothetical protein MPC1_7060006 [Methylocella tundrae]
MKGQGPDYRLRMELRRGQSIDKEAWGRHSSSIDANSDKFAVCRNQPLVNRGDRRGSGIGRVENPDVWRKGLQLLLAKRASRAVIDHDQLIIVDTQSLLHRGRE